MAMTDDTATILDLITDDGFAIAVDVMDDRATVTATDRGTGERWIVRGGDVDDAAFALSEMMGWD